MDSFLTEKEILQIFKRYTTSRRQGVHLPLVGNGLTKEGDKTFRRVHYFFSVRHAFDEDEDDVRGIEFQATRLRVTFEHFISQIRDVDLSTIYDDAMLPKVSLPTQKHITLETAVTVMQSFYVLMELMTPAEQLRVSGGDMKKWEQIRDLYVSYKRPLNQALTRRHESGAHVTPKHVASYLPFKTIQERVLAYNERIVQEAGSSRFAHISDATLRLYRQAFLLQLQVLEFPPRRNEYFTLRFTHATDPMSDAIIGRNTIHVDEETGAFIVSLQMHKTDATNPTQSYPLSRLGAQLLHLILGPRVSQWEENVAIFGEAAASSPSENSRFTEGAFREALGPEHGMTCNALRRIAISDANASGELWNVSLRSDFAERMGHHPQMQQTRYNHRIDAAGPPNPPPTVKKARVRRRILFSDDDEDDEDEAVEDASEWESYMWERQNMEKPAPTDVVPTFKRYQRVPVEIRYAMEVLAPYFRRQQGQRWQDVLDSNVLVDGRSAQSIFDTYLLPGADPVRRRRQLANYAKYIQGWGKK